jgi:16S rRNA (guanine966-N2)-methyltransferase
MRIISGQHRGRTLRRVGKPTTRETSDMVKESVFNMLGDITGTNVLDLYAGAGSYGLEALSRHAAHVTFVDHDPDAIRTIRSNLDMIKAMDRSDVIRSDAHAFLDRRHPAPYYDLVFSDPPYMVLDHLEILDKLSLHVTTDTKIVIETARNTILPDHHGDFALSTGRAYGNKRVSIYKKTETDV